MTSGLVLNETLNKFGNSVKAATATHLLNYNHHKTMKKKLEDFSSFLEQFSSSRRHITKLVRSVFNAQQNLSCRG